MFLKSKKYLVSAALAATICGVVAPATANAATTSDPALTGTFAETRSMTITTADVNLRDVGGVGTADVTKDAQINIAKDFWGGSTNGRYKFQRQANTTLNSSASSSDDFQTMLNKLASEANLYNTPNKVFVAYVNVDRLKRPSGTYDAFGAGMQLPNGSSIIIMVRPSSLSANIIAHEFGHGLGLGHANSLSCLNAQQDSVQNSEGIFASSGCSSKEYDDAGDLMGISRQSVPNLSASFLDKARLGRGDDIFDLGRLTSKRDIVLTPWGEDSINRGSKFTDINGETYYLEYRTATGYDWEFFSYGNEGVKITKIDKNTYIGTGSMVLKPSSKPGSPLYDYNQTYKAGQTFTTAAGTVVKINSLTAATATVTLTPKVITNLPTSAHLVSAKYNQLKSYPVINGVTNTLSVIKPVYDSVNLQRMVHMDFNNDGYPDIVSTWKDGSMKIAKGSKTGLGDPVAWSTNWATAEIAPITMVKGQNPRILERQLNGKLYEMNPLTGKRRLLSTYSFAGIKNLVSVDWDKDGAVDIMGQEVSTGKLKVYRTDGKGNLIPETAKVVGEKWNAYTIVSADSKGIDVRYEPTGKLMKYPINKSAFGTPYVSGIGWGGEKIARKGN